MPRRGDMPRRGGDMPHRGGDMPVRGGGMPQRGGGMPQRGGEMPQRGPMPQRGDMPVRGGEGQGPGGLPGRQAFPTRQPATRPPRPAGRHRRPVPASLPDSAPALVLAVPGAATSLTEGPVADIATMLRVDNPAVDVRAARLGSGDGDPEGLGSVLAGAAAQRPEGTPSAVVIPLIAAPHPVVSSQVREIVGASGVNAVVMGFINSNALIAEALHIRLAEAGLARADRVRLFSIVTAADGIIIATVGGPDAAVAANVTSVLLAARLALPVVTASADSHPSIQEAAMRLKEMGANRLAVAPSIIGPEATAADLEALQSAGAECAGLIGAHGNVARLAAITYGQAISQMQFPGEEKQLP